MEALGLKLRRVNLTNQKRSAAKADLGGPQICITRISGPDGPLILAVDLRNNPKGGGYGQTNTLLYIYR